MTIGPAPMIRMLSMSVRLGILVHQPDKTLEQVMAVLRPGARLRVVLHGKHRLADHPQALVAVVEEREMRRLDILGQAFRVNDKPMVLAGDLDLAGLKILDRVIRSAVTASHLVGSAAERQCQHLVTKADAEHRFTRLQQVAQHGYRVGASRGRVTGAVRQENAVGPMAHDVRGRGSGRNYNDTAAECGEHSQDVALGTVVNCYNAVAEILLQTVAAITIPYRLIPLVGLAAGHFFGEIHAFETRPGASPGLQ